MLNILLIDDEPSIRLSVGDSLESAGHQVTKASDGAEGMALATSRPFDLIISDISLPKADGMTIFRKVREESPTTDVILITANGKVTDAVTALREGAKDYLTKPFAIEESLVRVKHLAERRALERDLKVARAQLQGQSEEIIGQSPIMRRLLDRIETIAPSDAPVLITGESGTGKELVARKLHAQSQRAEKPFVAVNCAAFPESLLEAELFGHERGAFTGAVQKREGRFKMADGGTLFLDEIAEIPLPAQAKLLRVLQEGVFEPIGTNTSIKVNVRILSATHRNLRERISENRFREDLYYRLNVLDVHIPALRDRRGDLPILLESFLRKSSEKNGMKPTGIAPRAWAALSEYPFPGNVRELQHAVEHAVVLARGKEIDLDHLPRDIAGIVSGETKEGPGLRPLSVAMKEFEREYLLRSLHASSGKRGKAADLLGISRKNLWEKLRAHGLSDSDGDD